MSYEDSLENELKNFWAEMSACEHFVQIYDADDVFMDTLTNFIGSGLSQGHAAVVIATSAHRRELSRLLTKMGFDLEAAQACDQFISLDAEETIAKFMINGWPDDRLFKKVVSDILARATQNGRKVRAFGEMVALMWAKGQCGATVRLEHIWHHLCQSESFSLFCAYPKSGFTENSAESIAKLCAEHSKILAPDTARK